MHLDFGQDKQRLQSMLPSGNMCKSIDKSIAAHQIVASKIATSLISGDDRGVLCGILLEERRTAAAMMSVWKSKLRIVYVTNVEASVANDVSKIAECAHAMKLKHWEGRTLSQVNKSLIRGGSNYGPRN
jgi:hypothetical protein